MKIGGPGIEPRLSPYKEPLLPLKYPPIKVALKQLIRPICGLDSTSLFVIRVYSYEFVIGGHHHCCLTVFVDDTKMFSIFDSFHEFVESFLKLFHCKNFHFLKRITIRQAIITYLSANYFQHIHKLINSLTLDNLLFTFGRIKVELTCQSVHDTSGQKFFSIGRHWSLIHYLSIIGHLGVLVKGFSRIILNCCNCKRYSYIFFSQNANSVIISISLYFIINSFCFDFI